MHPWVILCLTNLNDNQSECECWKSPSSCVTSCCLSMYCCRTVVPLTMWTWTSYVTTKWGFIIDLFKMIVFTKDILKTFFCTSIPFNFHWAADSSSSVRIRTHPSPAGTSVWGTHSHKLSHDPFTLSWIYTKKITSIMSFLLLYILKSIKVCIQFICMHLNVINVVYVYKQWNRFAPTNLAITLKVSHEVSLKLHSYIIALIYNI